MMSCLQFPRPNSLLPGAPLCAKPKESDISYQLLLGTSASSLDADNAFHLCSETESNSGVAKEVTLNFYLEDGTHQRLVVEENLRVLDLCQLLALKINVPRSHSWTIVEQIVNLEIERSLEDHEDVLKVFASWGQEGKASENRFVFRQDFCKYEFFHTPQQFFPFHMLDLGTTQLDCLSECTDVAKLITLQNMINSGDKMPSIQGLLWCKEPGKDSWKRLFFKIDGSTLCVSSSSYNLKDPKHQLWPFRDLKEYAVYTPMEPKNGTTPTSYSFCLKPEGVVEDAAKNVLWLCCENERHRQCWIISLRLAKHGKKIRENHKEVQARHSESLSSATSGVNSGCNPTSSEYTPMKPRVAVDFTGSQTRIVEDPHEAKAIAAAEGHTWKRRLPCCRTPTTPTQSLSHNSPNTRPVLEFGVHNTQPWFYNGMSRDEATQLLTKYGTVDGVFLVRESRRNPGSFVLSYVYNRKVHHCQIFPVEEKEQLCYSLDNARTKFYDLLQLVEFYQLNLGSLPTKLTHFLVHRPRNNPTRPEL